MTPTISFAVPLRPAVLGRLAAEVLGGVDAAVARYLQTRALAAARNSLDRGAGSFFPATAIEAGLGEAG